MMKVLNHNIKKYIFLLFVINFLYPNNEVTKIIDKIHSGNHIVDYNNNISINSNVPESIYLKGLFEIDGEKSKDYFLEFYTKYPKNKYASDSVVKIAEYFYSKGLYLKSSEWYKKIPNNYPNSRHLDKSISYFLNSLVISGETDSAKVYTRKFNKQYKNLKFNNQYIMDKKIKEVHIINKKNNNTILSPKRQFSVQVGSYKNYQSAINKKRILSTEGFLSRVDELNIKGERLYSIRVGFYKKRVSAENEQKRLRSRLGIYDSIIIEVK